MSLVAAQNAFIAVSAAGQPDSDLIAMTNTVLDQMDSLWPPNSPQGSGLAVMTGDVVLGGMGWVVHR